MLLTLNTFLLLAAGFIVGVLLTFLLTRQQSEKQRAVSDVTISRL